MKRSNILTTVIVVLLLTSCISKKKLVQEQERYGRLNTTLVQTQKDLEKSRETIDESSRRNAQLMTEIEGLNKQMELLKSNNSTLSQLSNSQAQSIQRSIDNMGSANAFIHELQRGIARRDSLSMALVMNLKSALSDVNDEDINIQIEKSAVYINISDRMLFKSGSYEVNENAKVVLGKVARVLNSKPELEFLVEGHTDNVPISNSCIVDNWDLSTKRATAIVRILQNQYNIDPKRMTAGGRSEFAPLQTNETVAGKAANRRTRIVILPQLDQFMKLLEKPGGA
jgi:chemotaxis protein MotB